MEEFIIYLKDYRNRLQTALDVDVETVYTNGKEHLYKMRSQSKINISNEIQDVSRMINAYEKFLNKASGVAFSENEMVNEIIEDSSDPITFEQW